jgi:type II secretory pathway component HofQ
MFTDVEAAARLAPGVTELGGRRYPLLAQTPASTPRAPVDLDLKDVDIADVCRLLADVGHVNIVVADDVHGSVTLRLRGVPWDRALDVILETKGFHTVQQADVIIVRAR